uniref:Uncharacterized protein n=1 Tax=Aegilops tauschii subsp. strangulata TaxID=200361 RepID=A0A453HVE4_AEGTS
MVAEMRQPHALFRWASSARCLPLVEVWYGFLLSLASSLGSVSPSLSLLLLLLALLLLVRPTAYPTCFCLLPRVVRSLLSLCRSTHQGFLLSFLLHVCVFYFQYLLCHAVCLGDLLNICMSCWSFKCSGYGQALCVFRSRAAYISCMRVSRICPLVSVVIPILEVMVTRCPPCSLFLLYIEAYLSNSQTNFFERNRSSLQRQLWIWIHLAALDEGLDAIRIACDNCS